MTIEIQCIALGFVLGFCVCGMLHEAGILKPRKRTMSGGSVLIIYAIQQETP